MPTTIWYEKYDLKTTNPLNINPPWLEGEEHLELVKDE